MMANKKGITPAKRSVAASGGRSGGRVSQGDIPACSVSDSMRVITAIDDNYAGAPTPPLRVASAMGMQPNTGKFRILTGAAVAYGLAEGGAYSSEISITPLGKRTLRPLEEGDDLAAKREAFLRPRVIGDFLRKYNGSKFPREDIARHVFEDLGIPRDRVDRALTLVKEGAEELSLFTRINDVLYVDLAASGASKPAQEGTLAGEVASQGDVSAEPQALAGQLGTEEKPSGIEGTDRRELMRSVYLTHGKNRAFIEPLKRLLALAEMEPVVSVERETTAIPVPQKVMQEMRTCGAAIIHVDDELRLISPSDAKEQVVLNPNVLIEIGAAMALYGERFILLVKEGVALPSNLQGLYKVFYSGDALDGTTTIRLLEAIANLKKKPLPSVWIDE